MDPPGCVRAHAESDPASHASMTAFQRCPVDVQKAPPNRAARTSYNPGLLDVRAGRFGGAVRARAAM